MRVSPSRLWARVADRLGTDPESAQLEVLGAAGYSWCAPATDPSFPFHVGCPISSAFQLWSAPPTTSPRLPSLISPH